MKSIFPYANHMNLLHKSLEVIDTQALVKAW
jgi:hypothetical protein